MQTTQMTHLEELEQCYAELYKDVHGIKARWYTAATVEQARADIAQLEAEGKEVWAAEKAAQEKAVEAFEKRVTETIALGARDRETAVQWIHQAEGTQGDGDALCYSLNMPYGYFNKR